MTNLIKIMKEYYNVVIDNEHILIIPLVERCKCLLDLISFNPLPSIVFLRALSVYDRKRKDGVYPALGVSTIEL
ncbi:unnamed protein product [Leptidea sinapis]|uniref:Uncharacterized protein n=1 Tax=Leptidea sinapis TaxID=189913 RepID=A0A5E4QIU7_9NEOP|nr:unnamed protein product [Leptidea sinapis]